MLNSVEEAKEKTKNHAAHFSGKISLAAPACLRYLYLPSFARFRAAYAVVKLNILARSHANAISMVGSDNADLDHGPSSRIFLSISKKLL